MAVNVKKLQEYKKSGDKEKFYNELLEILQNLRKVVHLKIKQLEKKGIIEKNMYSAQEIVDDVFMKIYEELEEEEVLDEKKLKVRLFVIAKELLDNIRAENGKEKISTEALLKEEFKELNEKYSVDANGNVVLIEELDDISYHLDDYKDKILLLNQDNFDELVESFDLVKKGEELPQEQVKVISGYYSNLPEISLSLVSHFSFGKLTVEEIAEIHGISVKSVNDIINQVKSKLKKIVG
jgi:DNA-directed RNA polymerase specialized sigma24 family protein